MVKNMNLRLIVREFARYVMESAAVMLLLFKNVQAAKVKV
jgi:hypothetical protein